MHWNYRVVKTRDGDEEDRFAIHEVYYGEKDEVLYWTTDPIFPYGETEEDFHTEFIHYIEAFGRPVVDKSVDEAEKS